jgi:Glycosyl transferase family 64 domain
VLEYIDAHRNCEDIAMAFLVANATGSPPVYVRAPGLQDLGQGVRKVGDRMAPANFALLDMNVLLLVEVCACDGLI